MVRVADLLLNHLKGTLNDFRAEVTRGVIGAVNGCIRALRRAPGYRNLNYLLPKATAVRHKNPTRRFLESRVERCPGRFSSRAKSDAAS
jgi:hypothetical protein